MITFGCGFLLSLQGTPTDEELTFISAPKARSYVKALTQVEVRLRVVHKKRAGLVSWCWAAAIAGYVCRWSFFLAGAWHAAIRSSMPHPCPRYFIPARPLACSAPT